MKILVLIASAVILMASCNENNKKTDSDANQQTLYYGGDIITMERDTPTYAEAVVQSNGKIVFVGSKEEALKEYKGKAKEVDLKGKTMLPAFLDAHGHIFSVGFFSMCSNLLPPPDGPGHSIKELINTLKKYKDDDDGKYMVKKTGWLVGMGFDDSQLEEKSYPKATDLDKVSTEVPIIIIHQSGHLAVINTKALQMLNYTKDTKNPEGGVIRRDKEGNPNGILEEGAFFNLMVSVLGKMDDEMAMKSIKKGQEEYIKNGYLTAQDGRTPPDMLKALKAAAENNKLFIDVVSYPDITAGTDFIAQDDYSPSHAYKNRFRIGGVKLTLDGSPQGKTAWLSQCYYKNPEGKTGCYKGYPVMSDSAAVGYVKTAFKNKWQILCHANGDAAIDQYIKAIDAAEDEYGYPDHRSVLIHGQTLRKDQIPELVRLDIYPSLFPMHTFYWGDWYLESVLGEPRASYISPTRDVLDAGLNLTSHHDAPVTFPNSMRVLDATVNRVTRSGKILGPNQRLTPYEGLKTLTIWAANQYFEEDNKGTLTEGKLADFVILDKNPLKIDPMNIHDLTILESIKEGKTVFKK